MVSFDGTNWAVDRDCRDRFAPLAQQRTLSYLGGDGQAVAPVTGDPAARVELPHALQVGVATGGRPVPDARVQFQVTAGSGLVNGLVNASVVTTGADGVASCTWAVESGTPVQEVVAALLDTLRREHDFEVDLGHLAIFGRCTDCPPPSGDPA